MVVPAERSQVELLFLQGEWEWLDQVVGYPSSMIKYLDDADLDYVAKGWKIGFQIRRFTH